MIQSMSRDCVEVRGSPAASCFEMQDFPDCCSLPVPHPVAQTPPPRGTDRIQRATAACLRHSGRDGIQRATLRHPCGTDRVQRATAVCHRLAQKQNPKRATSTTLNHPWHNKSKKSHRVVSAPPVAQTESKEPRQNPKSHGRLSPPRLCQRQNPKSHGRLSELGDHGGQLLVFSTTAACSIALHLALVSSDESNKFCHVGAQSLRQQLQTRRSILISYD